MPQEACGGGHLVLSMGRTVRPTALVTLRMLLALLQRAASDDLAARTVLQAIMPGLKSLMSAYRRTAEPEEVVTAVIEAAFERIRCYPCDRRPERVAANLLNDTRQTLWRAAGKERARRLATEPLTEPVLDRVAQPEDRFAAGQLQDLVVEAVQAGRIDRSGARLILLTRVLDVTITELADETQAKPQTLRKRRRHAEAALAAMRMVA